MTKQVRKFFSLWLAVSMIVNLLPMSVLAEEAVRSGLSASTSVPAEQESIGEAQILGEVVENRSEYTKEFILSNGLHMAVVYGAPVHYQENGQWEEIDNTLVSSGTVADGVYTNTAGAWEVSFPRQISPGGRDVEVTKDGYTLSFTLSGQLLTSENDVFSTASAGGKDTFELQEVSSSQAQKKEPDLCRTRDTAEYPETVQEKLYSGLTYRNVFDNTHIIYDVTSNLVKESIVIEEYNPSLQGFEYVLNPGGMTPVLQENGEILFFAPDSKTPVMVMPAPFMVDGAENYNFQVTVELERNSDGTYTLTYQLPVQWLAEEDRRWPVILDPVVRVVAQYYDVEDQTVYENTSTSHLERIVNCGYESFCGAMRFYMRYNNLPALTSSDVIISASIELFSPSIQGGPVCVEVHEVTGDWTSSTINWTNQPTYNSAIVDYAICSTSQEFYSWDITDIVRGWYAGENTGMMFKTSDAVEEAQVNNWLRFYSSDFSDACKPTLSIIFRNNNGLEGYWDYTATSAGRAGTGYVNHYTGNLVWTHNDIGFGGNRMPVSISHVYNAGDSARNTFGMGYGWRTNFNQRVYHWNEINPYGDYYVWEDADGTKHYFYCVSPGIYKDEDGMELTLTVTSTGYKITDKYGNKSVFDTNGRLTQQTNNQETPSSITITYDVSGNISQITDGAGRVYQFTYLNSGLLGSIIYYGTNGVDGNAVSIIEFGYDENQNLTSVKYPDTQTCTYEYTNHLLSSAADIDDYTIKYEYSSTVTGTPNRIASISEFVGTNAGGSIFIEYGHNQTTFTDHNDNSQTVQFNNWGNTISVQDNQGRAQFAQFALNDPANPDDPNTASEAGYQYAKGNQLRLASKLQNTVGNVLNDSSFEQSGNWTATSSAVTVSVDSGTAYYGSNALKLVRSSAGTAAGAYSVSFSVEAGETYTFSAYVKTGAGTAYLALNDGSNTVTSETLAANSDWTRLEVSYTNNGSTAKTVTARLLTVQAGTVYMDCAQVEKAPTASRYNLVENGDFRYTGSWNLSTGRVTLTENTAPAPQLSGNVYKMTGNPTSTNRISQTINVSGEAGESFVLAGWAMADSAPLDSFDTNPREFALLANIHYTDGTTETVTVRFNPCVNTWQYAAGGFEAEKAFTHIVIELAYDYNVNVAYFDGIQLYNESFGTEYSYNENGDVAEVTDIQGGTTTYTYTGSDLTSVTLPDGSVTTYTYDNYHNVETATTNTGVVYELTYDAWGNNTSVAITSGTLTLVSSACYSSEEGDLPEDGNTLISTTDTAGNITQYGYNVDTNLLEWVQYPRDTESTRTEYTYDDLYRLTEAEVTTNQGKTMQVDYSYTNDLLTSVATPSTTYTLSYNAFSQIQQIKAGGNTLASYTYTADQNKYLQRLAYGNGDSVEYSYDSYGRLIKQTWEDGDTVSYAYDNSGALATVTDSATGRTTTYYYDFTDRLTKYVESGADFYHSVSYVYSDAEENGELKTLVETINGAQITTGYNYDSDNRVTGVVHSLNLDSDAEAEATVGRGYQYDAYGRIKTQITRNGNTTVQTKSITYRSPAEGATSGQVNTLKITSTQGGYSILYTYTYDANGNIASINDGTYTTYYFYDSQNQLIRENSEATGKSRVWTYDGAGNITSRKEYTYINNAVVGSLLSTVQYSYTNSSWGDLLTSYNGQNFIYDPVGNLTFDGTWGYTWEHGRQLKSMTGSSTTWNFTYNADGLRTGRTNGTTTYEYVYNGSQLTQMTVGTNTLYFTYDASGTPISVVYNGTTYFYATNLQGDVVAILDASGTAVVEYTYDAWGGHGSTSGTMSSTLGKHNPLRFRGYVYDQETDLYYLQSRYYNPRIGRFINADAYVSTGQGFTGNNMFAYCGNNPVNYSDPFGYLRYDVATCSAADADWGVREAAFLDPIYYKTEGLINGQGVFEFANEAFGLGTYAHNGCGIIAIYNVMQLLGTPESLGMICDEIINEGGLMLGGILGMNPFVIDDFFVSRGITCKGYSSFYALSKDVKEGTVILLMTLNNAYSLLGGAHFMAVQYVSGKYVVYNLFNNRTREYTVDSLDNPYGLNGFLYGFIIGG